MPELPEVEFARRCLERWFAGRHVVRTTVDARARTVARGQRPAFLALTGRLLSAARRGKYLLLSFEGGRGLVGHLGMTGKLVRRPQGEVVPHSRAAWVLDSGEVVHFTDPRMFGRLELAPADALGQVKAVAKLGVDPLVDGLSVAALQAALAGSRQALKVALMDQERVAGLGNIHAAEALFRARLHPAREVGSLTAPEWRRLHAGVHAALRFGLEEAGGTGDEIRYVEEGGVDNPFLVYGRAGTPCPRCRARVVSFPQAGRTTHACPRCQPLTPKGVPRRAKR